MPKITTPFAGVPAEVDEQEAGALKRMGLLSDTGPREAPAEEALVTVHTTFGRDVEVPPEEAESLRAQGLTIDAPAAQLPVRTPSPTGRPEGAPVGQTAQAAGSAGTTPKETG